MEGTHPRRDGSMTYREFGHRFIELAVTPERVARTIVAVAGDRLDIGPLRAGPADSATVTGTGRIGAPTVEPVDAGEWLAFLATLPVELDLDVVVAGASHRYDGSLAVPLHLTVRTAAPLRLVVDIAAPHARDIRVELRAAGLRSKALRAAGNIDAQVRRHAARIVRQRLADDATAAVRAIDLLPLIDAAWNPTSGSEAPPAT